MARLLIVSNRLPVTVSVDAGAVEVHPSSGGLATGLRCPHERSGGLWIGWPGVTDLDDAGRAAAERRLSELRAVPLWLTADEVTRFYEGFSNGVLWPLFHYLLDQVPLRVANWDAYASVNERFADLIAAHHQPGDLVWVHDYHLMLVPRLLRERVPDARIGFFLHIPFPSSEVFRTLPHREQILEGLLGADLIGFHTATYTRHFTSSLLRILGLGASVGRVSVGSREVRLGVFPMGVDAAAWAERASNPAIATEVEALRGADDCALLVGIDRLDYTKGIPRRLLAFEELLRREPWLAERVRLIQLAVPSRTEVEAYQEFRHGLEALVGRVNGAFATPRWTPIDYLYRSISEDEVVTLYRAADVMLVTPLRDGMNLVAKEFVAARTDEDGVLVLSELAGASADLAEALHVNPYDVERTAETYLRALTLPANERRARMRGLRRRILAYDVHHWVRSFLAALEDASGAERRHPAPPVTPAREVEATLARLRAARHLLLLLDYDGTLVPFAPVPELATPDTSLVELLRALASRPATDVHVVSGRSRETLDRWLGELPIGLAAEHGFCSRRTGEAPWVTGPMPPLEWRDPVREILERVTERTPGSLVEEKTVALAWHYRMADPEFGAVQANELRVHLTELLANAPVEILTGDKVIEVRPHGINKGTIVAPLVEAAPAGTQLVAFGDDRTDEDLFAALPEGALAVHVGPGASRAPIRLARVADARAFLRALVNGARV